MKKQDTKVYLSGGMKSNWQDKVTTNFKNKFVFYNPQEHDIENPSQYAIWDLYYVKQADIIFAYMEKNNPSGYGLALEVGYAKGLGKTVILVDETINSQKHKNEYFDIIRCCADIVFEDLKTGVNFLNSFK